MGYYLAFGFDATAWPFMGGQTHFFAHDNMGRCQAEALGMPERNL
jgi:hypothetical protein